MSKFIIKFSNSIEVEVDDADEALEFAYGDSRLLQDGDWDVVELEEEGASL